MNIEQTDNRCQAETKSGDRCKNRAQDGSLFCYRHLSYAEEADSPESIPVEDSSDDDRRDRRQQLFTELDDLLSEVRTLYPEYEPPLSEAPPSEAPTLEPEAPEEPEVSESRPGFMTKLGRLINDGLFDPEAIKGAWYMLNYTVEYQGDMIKRRLKGDYETDEWGLDYEFLELVRPSLDFLYKIYWRVESSGIENIPDYDRVLLVSNYSGELPWDSLMIMTAVLSEHPAQRLVRSLYPTWMPKLPFLSSAVVKMGQALASVDNGVKLLEEDELVCVYPEASRNFGKLFKKRYEMGRFESSSFVKMALETGTPIIPVSVVGAEETYVPFAQIPLPERFESFPHMPLTLRFPWLGLLGTIPLPSKWYIDFGQPINLDEYGPADSENLTLISELADKVRDEIQAMITSRVAARKSIFF